MHMTLPNLLTIGRIVLILPFALLLFASGAEARWAALALYALAAVTDWFDGYLARRLNQLSPFGRMLDPIADKLLVGAALLLLAADGRIEGWELVPAVAILLREIAVSGFREHLGALGVVVPVTQLAKWKTTVQLISLGLLIAPLQGVPYWLGLVLLWVAAILTLVTGWGYLQATLKALATPPRSS